jgi:hypothetical protein
MCHDVAAVLIDAAKFSLKQRKTKTSKNKMSTSKTHNVNWYNNNLYTLKCDVLHSAKLLQKFPDDPYIRGRYIVKKKMYKKACRIAKRGYYKNVASVLDSAESKNPKEYWRIIGELKTKTGENSEEPDMEMFKNYFEKLSQTYYDNEQFERKVVDEIETLSKSNSSKINIDILDQPIVESEIVKALSKLKNGKAFGHDRIINEMLKAAGPIIMRSLLKLFNLCLDTGYYPEGWCMGHIVPIFKSGDKSQLTNYRPITLSSCLGKLLSSVLKNRIENFLEINKVISNAQIGFRKGCRTSDHILLLKALIDSYKQRRKHIYACFVDFASAFDTVWHQGLILKLHRIGLSNKIIKLLQCMYSNIQSCIKKQGVVSETFVCNKGTRQGCCLSPTLFNIYINDLQECLNTADCDPVKAGQQNIGCLMYADDILILSQSAQGLQNALNKLNKYCKIWKLRVNPQKTKTMVFNSKRVCHTFIIGNQILQQVDRAMYLGFILTPSGKFKAMQKYMYNKSCRALFALRSALRGCTWMSVNTHIKLFDVLIKPILLYGSDVWGAYMYKYKNNKGSLDCMLTDVNMLTEKLHSKVCKYVLQVNKNASNFAVRSELGRYPLFINIISRLVNYYVNICGRDKDSLVHTALEIHKSTDESWFSFLKYIVEITGFNMHTLCKESICKK